MNAELEVQLIECLDALEQGEPLAQILARYPASAAQLRPLLTTATALPSFRMEPSEKQKMASRQAFLNQAATLRQARQPRRALGIVPRFATLFAALSVTLAVLGGGAVAASGSALPGDPLYGLKRTVETVRLAFTADAAVRAVLRVEFENQRRAEANALLDAGREIEVHFSGPIESIQPNAWVVAGLVVRIDSDTQIDGQPQIDRVAEVRGMTNRTGLRAITITIEPSGDPALVPTVVPTITPSPTLTATPNPSVMPEPTEPRPTREPLPTSTPVPTAQPTAIEFTGSVDSIDAATWVIDGAAVIITGNTEFGGNIGVGQRVKVQALRYANGRLVAQRIELINDGGGGSSDGEQNSNTNENDNENDNHNSNDNENNNENDNHNSNDNENHNGDDNKNGND